MSLISNLGSGFGSQNQSQSAAQSQSQPQSQADPKPQTQPADAQSKPTAAETKAAPPPPTQSPQTAAQPKDAPPAITPVPKPLAIEAAIVSRADPVLDAPEPATDTSANGLAEARAGAERYRNTLAAQNILSGLKAQNPQPAEGEAVDLRLPLPDDPLSPRAAEQAP